jgi:hypothetical protein
LDGKTDINQMTLQIKAQKTGMKALKRRVLAVFEQ